MTMRAAAMTAGDAVVFTRSPQLVWGSNPENLPVTDCFTLHPTVPIIPFVPYCPVAKQSDFLLLNSIRAAKSVFLRFQI